MYSLFVILLSNKQLVIKKILGQHHTISKDERKEKNVHRALGAYISLVTFANMPCGGTYACVDDV